MAQTSTKIVRTEHSESRMKDNLTPLMKQYEQLKAVHRNEILFFRLGDFYEMFGEDAKTAAPILEVALTQRQGVPMCGVPYHSVQRYIPKLLKKGFRVAIAEQMEDPETVKGIVKRDITRVISAGTIIEDTLLNEKTNNFLVALAHEETDFRKAGNSKDFIIALAALDISTGQLTLTEISPGRNYSNLQSELSRINPAEILLMEGTQSLPSFFNSVPLQFLKTEEFRKVETENFFPERSESPRPVDLRAHPLSMDAVKMLLCYTQKMNPSSTDNIQPPEWTSSSEIMTLDKETIENLEILKNTFDGSTAKTLLNFLDRTLTSMGSRLLRQWLVRPLVHLEKIQKRIQTVEFFLQQTFLRKACRETLTGVSDLERIIARTVSGQANPRDLIALKLSLLKVQKMKSILEAVVSLSPENKGSNEIFPVPPQASVQGLLSQIEDWSSLTAFLEATIAKDPPIYLENGGVICSGYEPFLDEKRKAAEEGKLWLADLEKREKEKTQISSLKIGYTSVFGYYFEVTKPHLPKVPPNWHRKQTLINAERFVNEELKELEQKILGAEEQCIRMERQIFQKILQSVKEKTGEIQKSARAIAELDCFLSLAEVAETKALAKPQIDGSDVLSIVDGWHPVVKESMPPGLFVPNDACLDGNKNQIIILTGPNMSGKSTYLRQVAIIVLMAQVGSFVPAKEAHIGLVDRIFTRIGSGDRLAQGESTFMVEMQETAKILNYATSRSLIILDEVGRGTSTYDGISIAWAIIEHLAKRKDQRNEAAIQTKISPPVRPKVLFATHYFELTHLAHEIEGIKNYNVKAKEWQDSVLFLHEIVPGPADRSYGIHVAQLAGLPPSVIQRAKKILTRLEQEHISSLESKANAQQELFQSLTQHD